MSAGGSAPSREGFLLRSVTDWLVAVAPPVPVPPAFPAVPVAPAAPAGPPSPLADVDEQAADQVKDRQASGIIGFEFMGATLPKSELLQSPRDF